MQLVDLIGLIKIHSSTLLCSLQFNNMPFPIAASRKYLFHRQTWKQLGEVDEKTGKITIHCPKCFLMSNCVKN